MLTRLKNFYNKEGFDWTQGYIDPLKYHDSFYFFLVRFQVGIKRATGIKAYLNQNTVLCINSSIACFLLSASFAHGVDTLDIIHMTETGSYLIILIYQQLILSTTRLHYEQYQNLIHAVKEDFEYICLKPSAQKYRKDFFDLQLFTRKICIFSVACTMIFPVGMVITNVLIILYFAMTHRAGDGKRRPLIYPFWIPGVDLRQTPIYEMIFVFANQVTMCYSYTHAFMVQTQIMWVRHIATKVDMIIWDIEDLLVDVHPTKIREEKEHFKRVIDYKMRHIIRQYQAMNSLVDDWVTVYKKLLMYEQKCCASVVCLSAYGAAEKYDQGEIQLILIIMLIGTIVLHFVTCYLCTYLTTKINTISHACWDTPFWNAGKVVRPYLVLLMQRSMGPLPLKAPGFEEISIQTFSTKMANAYSAFNMLRQANM